MLVLFEKALLPKNSVYKRHFASELKAAAPMHRQLLKQNPNNKFAIISKIKRLREQYNRLHKTYPQYEKKGLEVKTFYNK